MSLFGCLLIPQFPIWSARFTDPKLVGAPIIIHRNGKVFAACAHSLTMGVRLGWTLQRVQSLCPYARIKAHNAAEEAHAWEEVLAALYTITPGLESKQPGLIFFEPPSLTSVSWLSRMAGVAKLVRSWRAQAALASDRATAELAAHQVASGMVRRVNSARGFLCRTPTASLTQVGVSAVAIERLEWFGFKNVSDLTRLSREQISCQFTDPTHRNDADLLWRFARAGTPDADAQPVQSYQRPPVRISRFVFEQAATRPTEWESALDDAIQQTTAQLHGMSTGAVTLCLQAKTGSCQASKVLREAVSSPRNLFRVALDLMNALASGIVERDGMIEVQALEVRLSRLTGDTLQEALFDTRRYDTSAKRRCPPTLLAALRNLESRHTGLLWKSKLRDQYAPLPEDRFALVPALEEYP